jgi:hypothetical protein
VIQLALGFPALAAPGWLPAGLSTQETTMHPIIQKELMNARVADLHQRGERDRTARAAAGTARKPGKKPSPGYLAAAFRRRVLALLAACRPWHASSQPEQVPSGAPATVAPDTETF